MADESEVRGEILRLARRRAMNSMAAFRRKNDPAIVETRGNADCIWGEKMEDLAEQLPDGDRLKETMLLIGSLPEVSSVPLHLRPHRPKG